MERLRCVIVDDDAASMRMLSDFCQDVPYVDVTGRFNDPRMFVRALGCLDFDLCLLDLNMSKMSGLKVAEQLNGKPIIFVTGRKDSYLADAISMAPLDIVLKPLKKERINIALSKAQKLLGHNKESAHNYKEYGIFSLNGEPGKTRLRLTDILYAYVDEINPRHKHMIMCDGTAHLLVKCTFEELLEIAPNLARVNKNHVVAVDKVRKFEFDLITLDYMENGRYKQVTLARTYRDDFKRQLLSC
ncbi:MAG TPA: response regulator [Bacteroidia bacterium]|jgi:DNA-binding LytR/AlgR family response regulator|nr:response regulator [Bacteroidia bacterium]